MNSGEKIKKNWIRTTKLLKQCFQPRFVPRTNRHPGGLCRQDWKIAINWIREKNWNTPEIKWIKLLYFNFFQSFSPKAIFRLIQFISIFQYFNFSGSRRQIISIFQFFNLFQFWSLIQFLGPIQFISILQPISIFHCIAIFNSPSAKAMLNPNIALYMDRVLSIFRVLPPL